MTRKVDIAIVGGGLNGAALAVALRSGGFDVVMIDAADPAVLNADAFDGRASAIASASRRMFETLGVWPDLAEHAGPILDILVTDGRVSEGAGAQFLHFDHRESGEGPFGHIIENRFLRRALYAQLDENTIIAPARSVSVMRDSAGASVMLDTGAVVEARLVIASDGRNSATVRAAGIRYTRWKYNQCGIVCTVEHDSPHQGVAHEYFLPSGPFAILPLPGNRSSLVWTERPDITKAVMSLSDQAFDAEMRRRFGDFLGDVRTVGPRWSYPLSFSLAREFVLPRLALVGDAAHGVHPIAGQGFNLGLRDTAALAEVLTEAARRGEDIGAADVLDRYAQWRRFDATLLGLGMDAMNRLFSNDLAPVRTLRDAGLSIVNRIAPARRFFTRHAAGSVGDLPRLLRGEAL